MHDTTNNLWKTEAYSVGNVNLAGKTPPSKHVPSGPLNAGQDHKSHNIYFDLCMVTNK